MVRDSDANWALVGESFITFVTRPLEPAPSLLTPPMHRIPGPTIIVAERFVDSPVGPFLSLSVGQPVRIGLRPAMHFGLTVVSSKEARRLGRLYWGYPHQLGALTWLSDGHKLEMEWADGGVKLTADLARHILPIVLPMRSFQRRSDGPVAVPGWARGLVRRSRTVVESTEEGPLASIAGIYSAIALSGLVVHRRPARKPHGLLTTLRAPLHSPEPGIAGMRQGVAGRHLPSRRSASARFWKPSGV